MTKKESSNLGQLLKEIALAITPIVLEKGLNWLESRQRAENPAPPRKRPKAKTA